MASPPHRATLLDPEARDLGVTPGRYTLVVRAAPAKNRIWSIIGGISSDRVRPVGLPVFSTSAAISSSARDSNESAMRSRASWRSISWT